MSFVKCGSVWPNPLRPDGHCADDLDFQPADRPWGVLAHPGDGLFLTSATRTLELKPEPKLQSARSVSDCRRVDDTERRIAGSPSRVRRRKARMIESVEDIGPQLQLHRFPRRELLVQT